MLSQSRQPDTNGGQNKHRKQIACQHSGGNHQPWPKRLSASTPLANPICSGSQSKTVGLAISANFGSQ
ncbi:hypothetical protein FNH47_00005 [Salmonella enterica subsp. houtenae]|uniref:Uncharacterized protein n=1 Tax=Salmonella houtenae TaxID=59205 RepID=A0A5Y2S7G5_SALHO|nr:hypothetical protein [Salmonella enterica subsp. houtenae]